ncbi:MAG: hypothetical protein BIFFINMI_01129 [Phycisphaerae bacterium]|nr:hypothetical protein [Phycisphaerae bacterium]
MTRRGFTLMEVLLAIALLVILAAMVMPTFSGQLEQRRLISSAEQLRGLLYMASAQAQQRGCRLEVRFVAPPAAPMIEGQPAATSVRVYIERDPLAKPGAFEPLMASWADWQLPGSQLQVVSVTVSDPIFAGVTGETKASYADDGQGGAAPSGGGPIPSELSSVVFAPDGSSQVGDVTITIRNRDGAGYDVFLRGQTGLATIQPAADLTADAAGPQ